MQIMDEWISLVCMQIMDEWISPVCFLRYPEPVGTNVSRLLQTCLLLDTVNRRNKKLPNKIMQILQSIKSENKEGWREIITRPRCSREDMKLT